MKTVCSPWCRLLLPAPWIATMSCYTCTLVYKYFCGLLQLVVRELLRIGAFYLKHVRTIRRHTSSEFGCYAERCGSQYVYRKGVLYSR